MWGVSSLQLVKADVHTSVPLWVSTASYWDSKPGTQHCFFVFFFSPKKKKHYEGEINIIVRVFTAQISENTINQSLVFPKELATNIYK